MQNEADLCGRCSTVRRVGSQGKRRGRRTRSDRLGGRADITRGVRVGGGGRTYDPPWRSIPEGRGLPRTKLIRAMLPFAALAAMAVLLFILVAATISSLID
jgi:hypothetical protein